MWHRSRIRNLYVWCYRTVATASSFVKTNFIIEVRFTQRNSNVREDEDAAVWISKKMRSWSVPTGHRRVMVTRRIVPKGGGLEYTDTLNILSCLGGWTLNLLVCGSLSGDANAVESVHRLKDAFISREADHRIEDKLILWDVVAQPPQRFHQMGERYIQSKRQYRL